jgi:hypothetical protein
VLLNASNYIQMKKYTISAVLLFCGLSIMAQSFKIVKAPNVDVTVFETFTVARGELITPKDDRKISEDELFKKMKNAIVTEFEAKGYRFVDDSSAQLIVSYVTGSFKLTNSENLGPLGETPASTAADVDQSRSWSRDFRESLLEIEVSDLRSSKELWKTSGTILIDSSDTKLIDSSVYKALKKFPKRKKKS